MLLLTLVAFVLFLIYAADTAAAISRRSLTEWLIITYLLVAGTVIFTGFCLSALYLTNSRPAWAVSVFLTASLLRLVLFSLIRKDRSQPRWTVRSLIRDRRKAFQVWFASLPVFPKVLFGMLFGTLSLIALTNLLLVLFTVPNEWDSMTGHLNRVVQYMQRGTMRHFGGTNWNMDTYPKSVCTLQIFFFLMMGKFENAFKFIHHLSYWMAAISVFAISQRLFNSLSASFLAALCYALFPDVLMQATTTETDIVLAGYLGSLLYFLFAYRESTAAGQPQNRYLYLAGMAFGIVYGHKITFTLLLPSVFVIMLYTVFWSDSIRTTVQRTLRLGAAIAVAMCLWTFPTGYLKNIEVFGHPIGPPTALKHQSVERAGSLRNLLEQGSRNVVRYTFDHINLDGLRNTQAGLEMNSVLRRPLVWVEQKLKLRLDEETDFSIQPFAFERRFDFYNVNPYWGILGFGFVFPLLLLTFTGVVRSRAHLFIGIALLLHFAALSYSAPYDPFKGRYFTSTGLFGALFIGLLFADARLRIDRPGRLIVKIYAGVVILTGCLSALLAVLLNERSLPFASFGRPSAFAAERIYQMTLYRPDIYVPYKRFDELVPANATVALGTINDDFEYPLYGSGLTRRLIPINPFEKGVQPIPPEADYLFFSKNVIRPRTGDIRLGTDTTLRGLIVPGEDYYLRKLK